MVRSVVRNSYWRLFLLPVWFYTILTWHVGPQGWSWWQTNCKVAEKIYLQWQIRTGTQFFISVSFASSQWIWGIKRCCPTLATMTVGCDTFLIQCMWLKASHWACTVKGQHRQLTLVSAEPSRCLRAKKSKTLLFSYCIFHSLKVKMQPNWEQLARTTSCLAVCQEPTSWTEYKFFWTVTKHEHIYPLFVDNLQERKRRWNLWDQLFIQNIISVLVKLLKNGFNNRKSWHL